MGACCPYQPRELTEALGTWPAKLQSLEDVWLPVVDGAG